MARDFAGKAIGVWLPDAAFVSMVRGRLVLLNSAAGCGQASQST